MSLIIKLIFLSLIILANSLKADEVSLKNLIESEVIIGNNNTIEKSIIVEDSGVDAYLDIASNEDVYKIVGRVDDGFSCIDYSYEIIFNKELIIPKLSCHGLEELSYFLRYLNSDNISSFNISRYKAIIPTSTSLPFFELRVINNTNRSISLSDIVFEVSKSTPYKEPLVFFLETTYSPGYLTIINEGNTTIDEINLTYKVLLGSDKKYTKIYKYNDSKSLQHFSLDFSDMLKEEGVDIEYLRNVDWSNDNWGNAAFGNEDIMQALGKFKGNYSVEIAGEYIIKGKYKNNTIEKEGKFKSDIRVNPTQFPLGDIPISPKLLEVKLKNKGSDYPVNLRISSYIKPFEAEKFIFKLSSMESAWHNFRAKVKTSDNQVAYTKNKSVFLFNSLSSKARELEKRKQYAFLTSNYKKDDFLNIRHEPSVKGKVIGKIPLGEEVNGVVDARKNMSESM